MMESRFTVFQTPIGHCGVIWGADGLLGVQLPEGSEATTSRRVLERFPGCVRQTPRAAVERAIGEILALLSGEPSDLLSIELDMEWLPPFHRSVYEVARSIPPSQTLTYGEVAARTGEPKAARAVGQALGRNPFPLIVPCHRVLAAGGKMGGFSARGGLDTKRRLLEIEGWHPQAPALFA